MFLADPTLSRPRDEADGLEGSIARATEALLKLQHADGHWVFDLEADPAIPAEYVMILHFLGERDAAVEQGTANYLRRRQEAHGGWPMLIGGGLNISASVKAYFALKLVGDSVDAPHMVRAREAILAAGGAVKVNIFTRISLALYGIVPWEAVPVMPVEIMHAPLWFPFNLWRCSFWARDTLVPLMVMMDLKPRAANPLGMTIDELFRDTGARGSALADEGQSGRLLGRGVRRARQGPARGTAAVPEEEQGFGHRQGRRLRHRATQRRGWLRRDLPVDRLHRHDVQDARRAGNLRRT